MRIFLVILALALVSCASHNIDKTKFVSTANSQVAFYNSVAAVTPDNCQAFEDGALALETGPDKVRGVRVAMLEEASVELHKRAVGCFRVFELVASDPAEAVNWQNGEQRFRNASLAIWAARLELVEGE